MEDESTVHYDQRLKAGNAPMTHATPLNRRAVLVAAGAATLVACSPSDSSATQLAIKVYKDPSCGCCTAWVDHLKSKGFTAAVEERADMNDIKEQLGVPSDLTSCHTGVIAGYTIEGHVPADDVKRLVRTKPPGQGPCRTGHAHQLARHGSRRRAERALHRLALPSGRQAHGLRRARVIPRAPDQSAAARKRSALAITLTELSDIAAAAIIGLKSSPKTG